MDSGAACASLCLHLRRILGTSFRVATYCHTVFSAPILLQQPASSSHCGACVSGPVGFPSQNSLDWLQPPSFLQLLTLRLCCPFRPIDPGLLQKHVLYVLQTNHFHVHSHLPFKQHSMQLWPLNAEITSFPHNPSCRSSHLCPSLCLKISGSSTLSAAPFSICSSTLLPPKRAYLQTTDLQEKTRIISCPLLKPSAAPTSISMQAKCRRLLLVGTKPILNSFLRLRCSHRNDLDRRITYSLTVMRCMPTSGLLHRTKQMTPTNFARKRFACKPAGMSVFTSPALSSWPNMYP